MQPAKPGLWWYGVAAAILAAGVGLFAWLLITGIGDAQKDFQRGPVPGAIELHFAKPGKATIFYESVSLLNGKVYNTNGATLPPLSVGVTAKDSGASVDITDATGSQSYSFGSRAGESIFAFEASQPGTYILTAGYDKGAAGPEIVLAVSQTFGVRLTATILSSIATLFAALALALGIGAVTFTKRRRAAS